VADESGVDTTGVVVLATDSTGHALITVGDDAGENTIVVVPGANAAVHVDGIPECRVVLAQLEVPLEAVVAAFVAAKQAGATTILNPAPARELPSTLLAVTDVIVPNEHEIELIGGVDGLLGNGPSIVIVTRGGSGADVFTAPHHSPTAHAALAVEPVDTTGAGDSFCGALAARLAAGAPIDNAVRWAIVAGGLATTVHGAIPSIPDAAAIAARLVD
jgi:ribokinase